MKNNILIALLLLVTTSYGQEKKEKIVLVNSNIVKSLLLNKSKIPKIIKATKKEVDFPIYDSNGNLEKTEKKKVYLTEDKFTDPKNINGRFRLIEKKWVIATKDIPNHFFKNEIVPNSYLHKFREFERNYKEYLSEITFMYGLKDIESETIYLIDQNNYMFVLGIEDVNKCLKEPFTFDLMNLRELGRKADKKELGYLSSKPLTAKKCKGIFEIDSIVKHFNFNNLKYLKFTQIPKNTKFRCLTNLNDYENTKDNSNVILQNIKSKKLYVIMGYTMTYRNPSNFGNSAKNNGYTIKYKKRGLNSKQKQILRTYKKYILVAKSKMTKLRSIQKKYVTIFGYFDSSRVPQYERKTYNKTLKEIKALKIKFEYLNNEKDPNFVIRDKLTGAQLYSITFVFEWDMLLEI